MLGSIIMGALKTLGWQKLAAMAYNSIRPELVKLAEKTETKFDDNVLEILDEVVSAATGKPVKK